MLHPRPPAGQQEDEEDIAPPRKKARATRRPKDEASSKTTIEASSQSEDIFANNPALAASRKTRKPRTKPISENLRKEPLQDEAVNDQDEPEGPFSADDAEEEGKYTKGKKPQVVKDPWKVNQYELGYDNDGKPFYNIQDIILNMARVLMGEGIKKLETLAQCIRLATVCSGSESPVLALILLRDAFKQLENEDQESFHLAFEHCFSAEIVPWKQAYIQRNFNPPLIFRDITEFSNPSTLRLTDGVERFEATTAFGAKEFVPDNIHLFVAGFCCVDFSALNSQKKSMAQGGESGDTFHATVAYIKAHKPTIVILENVLGAPWIDELNKGKARKKAINAAVSKEVKAALAEIKSTQGKTGKLSEEDEKEIYDRCEKQIKDEDFDRGIDWHLERAGYKSTYMSVDTKNYYIPQTRQRGYLVAISLQAYRTAYPLLSEDETLKKINIALGDWRALMKRLENKASVPVDAMLMAAEGEARPGISRIEEVESEDKKAIDWVRCKVIHQQYRALCKLGNEHKLTLWSKSGFRKILDHWTYLKGMTDRVADTLEISHNRCIIRGWDDRYQSRYLELSQNVHRIQDTTKDGLIGCLTPNGIPFWTYAGRRITGREALVLQGIPVNLLDLSHLTEAQLQNFSGNAMSLPVVASAMMSALIVFAEVIPRGNGITEIDKPIAQFDRILGLIQNDVDPTVPFQILSVEAATTEAARTVSLCRCEGRHNILPKIFVKCDICGHTGCKECTGNPTHSFRPIVVDDRQLPLNFQRLLKESLPTKIFFVEKGDIVKRLGERNPVPGPVSWEILQESYREAFYSELLLTKITRSQIWEVVYESSEGKLVLTITGSEVKWLLYALPPSDYGLGHPLRRYLEAHPIARLVPTSGNLTHGNWQVFLPTQKNVIANFISKGPIVSSYESWIGLEDHQNDYLSSRFTVKLRQSDAQLSEVDISGDYEYYQNCGQAFGSLHVKSSTKNDIMPLFFFRDHFRQRDNPKTHPFVFTQDPSRQKPTEMRSIIAQAHHEWRQPVVRKHGETYSSVKLGNPTQSLTFDNSEDVNIEQLQYVTFHGSWVDSDLSIGCWNIPSITFHQLPANRPSLLVNDFCTEARTVLTCEGSIPREIAIKYPKNEIVTVGVTNESKVISDFLWMLQPSLATEGYLEADEIWYPVTFASDASDFRCEDCAPTSPPLFWALKERKKGLKQELFEDPKMAALYELRLKNRPKAISVEFFIGDEDRAEFQVQINAMTLIHRAVHDLDPLREKIGVDASVCLITDDSSLPLVRLAAFKFPDRRETQNFEEYQLPGAFSLRIEQCRSVAWQVRQEESRPYFLEEVIVEERSRLGYRVSAKAAYNARVRGGCIFHPVGFGKTAVMLGMMHHQRQADEQWAQQAEKEFSGKIPLKATIVFMAEHLCLQWESEVTKFLGKQAKGEVIVITKVERLAALSVEQMRAASIIIVNWAMLDKELYLDRLAMFAGMTAPDLERSDQIKKFSNRTKETFHKSAVVGLQKNIALLQSDPDKFEDLVHSQIVEFAKNARNHKIPTLSRRLRGSNYTKSKEKVQKPTKEAEEAAHDLGRTIQQINIEGPQPGKPWDTMTGLPLESYHFRRMGVDEFIYIPAILRNFLENVEKDLLWLICATPQLANFEEVRKLAALFNINLGVQDFALMEDDKWKALSAVSTETETFLRIQSRKSSPFYEFRHRKAQEFVNNCAIRDLPTYGELQRTSYIRLSHAPAAQKAATKELMHFLAIPERGGALPHKPDTITNTDLQICAAIEGSITVIPALMAHSSFFDNFTDPLVGKMAQTQEGLNGRATSTAVTATALARRAKFDDLKSKFMAIVLRILWYLEQRETKGLQQMVEFCKLAQRNYWGDKVFCNEMIDWINTAKADEVYRQQKEMDMQQQYSKGKAVKFQGKKQSGIEAAFRSAVAELTISADALVKSFRGTRYMDAVEACQRSSVSDVEISCNSCGFQGLDRPLAAKGTVLTECGHTICAVCGDSAPVCPVEGCDAGCESYGKTLCSEFALLEDSSEISRFGEKLDDLVRLITAKIPVEDRILVFVQTEAMADHVQQVLKISGVKYAYLNSKDTGGNVLRNFQKIDETINKTKVLVMRIGSASAAGCNLTVANHVIFLGPFYTAGSSAQVEYESSMEQAIGRAFRFGQNKHVYIHHMMLSGTVDVDIYENRHKKIICAVPTQGHDEQVQYELVDRPDDVVCGPHASVVAYLIHNPGGTF